MENVVPIKLQPLTAEAFSPYGSVLGLKSPAFPEVEGGRPVVLMSRIKRGTNNNRLEELAIHFSYNQTFIPVRGSMALVVAPPPHNQDAGPEGYQLDYDKIAAFVMEPGDAVIVDRGTWHTVVAIGDECLMISGTRKGAEEGNTGEVESGRIPAAHNPVAQKATPFIEFVNLKKRDNRIMELQL